MATDPIGLALDKTNHKKSHNLIAKDVSKKKNTMYIQ